ncbi:ankyrin repeat domain-containing protein [Magnetovibrio sp. PR-2]|uniref:ankyrin repeat domain-containing protein n=1 Tax=Magnetovibrio sp. PR-2 TaxID=3120356 RepID=UPI002FCE28A7
MIKTTAFLFALSTSMVTVPAWAGNEGCTLLHEAAFLDEPGEIQDLIHAGVDVECKDVLGHTAIVTAVNGASMDSFKVLLDAGAKTNVKTEWGNSLLQHTKRKFRSVDHQKGLEQYRDLYQSMIARLQTAGATN